VTIGRSAELRAAERFDPLAADDHIHAPGGGRVTLDHGRRIGAAYCELGATIVNGADVARKDRLTGVLGGRAMILWCGGRAVIIW
jgi:hypothetical protein